MLTRRVIPCLDVADGRVVKGTRFSALRDKGDPVELALAYEEQGADEIMLLDISATSAGRPAALDVIARCRRDLSIPLTVGGGVGTVADAGALLDHGADRVAVNTAAVLRPDIVSEMARRFGAQCVVVAIDARRTLDGGWNVLTHAGRIDPGIDAVGWARQVSEVGAGELLVTGWDRDGTGMGYDLGLLHAVCAAVPIPVVASGGASCIDHMRCALESGADAVLAASIFHDGVFTVGQVKAALATYGVEVRL